MYLVSRLGCDSLGHILEVVVLLRAVGTHGFLDDVKHVRDRVFLAQVGTEAFLHLLDDLGGVPAVEAGKGASPGRHLHQRHEGGVVRLQRQEAAAKEDHELRKE
mmetsp:Transcript_7538/g.18547  ORF Transcript_7538/g.18547 Transcript_7538/m.18547 type:complete len:104 (-) Transcript_7538:4043-4354(-)